ncbi:doxX family protein [Escherichia coli Jurua 18/11]|uniref:DoxX family protein n=1 Tax=Escherichia coli TaxID=562 RepID=UPI0002CBC7B0|nr:DoxX family protein [Escherichia coli]EMX58110.1 doxX family protein [Escherichia coli Jurua 18/11]
MALMRSFLQRGQALLQDSLIPLLARTGPPPHLAVRASKVEGLVLDILGGMPPELDVPHITRSAVALFATEYRLPFLAPETAALLAAGAEHIFPVLLVLGLATRFSDTSAGRNDDSDPGVCLSRCLAGSCHLAYRPDVFTGVWRRKIFPG